MSIKIIVEKAVGDKCLRCKNIKNIPYPLKICDSCQDMLKENFPDIYEQSRLENMKLWDEQHNIKRS